MAAKLDHVLDPTRIRVVDLNRFPAPGSGSSRWSCTRCGDEHPANESWAVTFDTVRGPVVAVVCAECSQRFRGEAQPRASI